MENEVDIFQNILSKERDLKRTLKMQAIQCNLTANGQREDSESGMFSSPNLAF